MCVNSYRWFAAHSDNSTNTFHNTRVPILTIQHHVDSEHLSDLHYQTFSNRVIIPEPFCTERTCTGCCCPRRRLGSPWGGNFYGFRIHGTSVCSLRTIGLNRIAFCSKNSFSNESLLPSSEEMYCQQWCIYWINLNLGSLILRSLWRDRNEANFGSDIHKDSGNWSSTLQEFVAVCVVEFGVVTSDQLTREPS